MKEILSYFFRLLLPSYNYFSDDVSPLSIQFRYGGSESSMCEWNQLFKPLPRKFYHLFFNPIGNWRLYEISSFHRFASDPSDRLSFATCEQITKNYLPPSQASSDQPIWIYQFRILSQPTPRGILTSQNYESPLLRTTAR